MPENCVERETCSPRWRMRRNFKRSSMIHYTVSTNKPYLLACMLVDMRIPFDFNPTQKYNNKKWKNGYGASVFEIDFPDTGCSIADVMYNVSQRPNGALFKMTIISQYEF